MLKMRKYFGKTRWLTPVAVYALVLLLNPFMPRLQAASILQDRSLYILTSAGGANTTHTFTFTFPNNINVGSIQFEYCTDPIEEITCDTPNGLDVSGATFDSQSGETGFSLLSASANGLILSRPAAVSAPQPNSYTFSNVVNPSDIGPFFVRIHAFPSLDATGAELAFNSVAGSITTGVNINAEVPQILYFCSAVTVPTHDCTDAAGDFIDFGILSPSATRIGTSQFLIGTNAPTGYNVTVNGPTMVSGVNQIAGMAVTNSRKVGTAQFGMNLRANLDPLIGSDKVGGSGFVSPNYDTPDKFHYLDGDNVVSGLGPTEIEVYTVSYIINVPLAQAAGIYNTTLTYICTAGF